MTQAALTLSGLAPKFGSRKKRKRLGLGDGSGLGKTAGRGGKGQTSRSGDGKMVGFEGGQNPLLRRIPKRGFRNTAFRTAFQVVSLADVMRVFKNTAEVSLEALRVHGLVKGQAPVKVLGDGSVEKPIKVQAHAFSKSALEKIQKAGGTAEVVAQAV
ncbi:MAG: 50S ribosomal protein L15 [Elusimicrobia bacterium]|nr:50S ribosomal protein L15 [Elusimicrobiota bacterium]